MNSTKNSRSLSSASVRALSAKGFEIVGTAAQRGDVWIARHHTSGWIVKSGTTRLNATNLTEAIRLADTFAAAPEDAEPALVPMDDVTRPAGGPARAFGPHDEPCIVCGRPIDTRRPYTVAQFLNSGHFYPVALKHEDSQGWHAIGSECAKRLPKGYTKKVGALA